MSKDRVDRVKKGLEKEIYKQVDKLDDDIIQDHTKSSTDSLKNILKDEEKKTSIDDTIQVLSANEIELEAEDNNLVSKYNDYLNQKQAQKLDSELGSMEFEKDDFIEGESPSQQEIYQTIDFQNETKEKARRSTPGAENNEVSDEVEIKTSRIQLIEQDQNSVDEDDEIKETKEKNIKQDLLALFNIVLGVILISLVIFLIYILIS